MIILSIFVAILPVLPITRPKADEGLETSNRAESHPADHTLIPARALLASSSAPRDHEPPSASPSSPSKEPSAGGMVCPRRPTTPAVSGGNTTSTSTTSGSAAPSTSIVTSGRDGAFNIERPREEPRGGNDDDRGPFKLDKTFLGLAFQAGLGLMIYREQPPLGDSSTHLSSRSSGLLSTVGATTLLGFAFCVSGIALRRHHPIMANICSNVGALLGVIEFLFMMAIAAEPLVWLVWAVGGVLFLVFAYTLCRELEI